MYLEIFQVLHFVDLRSLFFAFLSFTVPRLLSRTLPRTGQSTPAKPHLLLKQTEGISSFTLQNISLLALYDNCLFASIIRRIYLMVHDVPQCAMILLFQTAMSPFVKNNEQQRCRTLHLLLLHGIPLSLDHFSKMSKSIFILIPSCHLLEYLFQNDSAQIKQSLGTPYASIKVISKNIRLSDAGETSAVTCVLVKH